VHFWNAESGAPAGQATEHGGAVSSMAFSPDGARLASGARDGTAVIWDAAGARKLHVLRGGQDRVAAVVFSPDGQTLATGHHAEARLWDVATGLPLATLAGYEQAILSAAFSPDGKTLAALGSDGVAQLWSVPEGKRIQEYRTPVNGGYDVAFSPDGQRLFVASGEGRVFVWDVATGALVDSMVANAREGGLPVEWVAPLAGDQLLTISRDGSLLVFKASPADGPKALRATGERSNYRVCRADFRVVAVTRPEADSVWAPEEACGPEAKSTGP
jgi:WD40 repeat protein